MRLGFNQTASVITWLFSQTALPRHLTVFNNSFFSKDSVV
jgi:hypothetical protein